ncbi:hypothetical protein HPB50_022077 [Hyalomma asiaticum]|uniref:Uncharacterized protein n=1 Tax=Hyalomma asiaticum TaxID=266040 RepID=A0ACB7TLQ3_HYAAI|nr:hypothetical protein HPB50_022077 [Hyalomma asiaticum]
MEQAARTLHLALSMKVARSAPARMNAALSVLLKAMECLEAASATYCTAGVVLVLAMACRRWVVPPLRQAGSKLCRLAQKEPEVNMASTEKEKDADCGKVEMSHGKVDAKLDNEESSKDCKKDAMEHSLPTGGGDADHIAEDSMTVHASDNRYLDAGNNEKNETVLEELQQKLNICGSQSVAPVEEMVTKGSFWICEFQGDRNWYRAQVLDVLPGSDSVLEELQQKLNICGSQSVAPVEEMVTKGSFWICEFQGDRNWYRAQVLDVLPGSDSPRYRVLYVDYGNRSTVTCPCLRPLPLELACLPACAHRMSLAFLGPKQGNKWDESATGVFVKETGFNVSLIAEKKGHRRSG